MTELERREQAAAVKAEMQSARERLAAALQSLDYERALACQMELDRLEGERSETTSRPSVTRQPVASVADRRRRPLAQSAEAKHGKPGLSRRDILPGLACREIMDGIAGLSVVKIRHEAMRWRQLAADATTSELRKHLLALARECEHQALVTSSRSAR
jgi:hypothetical protein